MAFPVVAPFDMAVRCFIESFYSFLNSVAERKMSIKSLLKQIFLSFDDSLNNDIGKEREL